MRQTIGTTWVLQLVIVFMLIFVAFLALSINYTKAFQMKNELLGMIEKYEGVTNGDNGSISLINNYLRFNNYTTNGGCQIGEYGVRNLNENTLTPITQSNQNQNYYYCVSKIDASTETLNQRARYRIRIFFKFGLPVIGDIFTFSVEGTTINLNRPFDDNMTPIEE